jgi:hypothetical protein
MSGLVLSVSILANLSDKYLIIIDISSILSSWLLLVPDVPTCSFCFLLYLSLSPYSFLTLAFHDAIMLDSISMQSSCILVKVVDLLSLSNKEKSGLKEPTKVTFVSGCDYLTSKRILL